MPVVRGLEAQTLIYRPMMEYAGNFEVHLTVAPTGQLEQLSRWCDDHGLKFVHILLSRGAQADQPMVTWRLADAQLSQVLKQSTARAAELESLGYTVQRIKIETDPNNQQVPLTDEEARTLPAENYFECHIKLRRRVTAKLDMLLQLCMEHGAHLSRNARRHTADGFEERFVTLRAHACGRSTCMGRLNSLLEGLRLADEQILEVESEYAVFDSNLQMDAGWLSEI